MGQFILAFSGKKGSGKNTSSNFLHGLGMRSMGVIDNFSIDSKGRLVVPCEEDGIVFGEGILDLDDKSDDVIEYLENNVWKYIKAYSFADSLKEIAMCLFGLNPQQCFGSNDDKNSPTQIRVCDIAFALPPRTVGELKKSDQFEKPLSAREFLQYFGTNICRRIYGDCWVDACIRRIRYENKPFAVISDCRFPNEADGVQAVGGKVVRFLRNPFPDDQHESETALDNYDKFDFVLDNSNMSIEDQNNAVLDKLIEWGWVNE